MSISIPNPENVKSKAKFAREFLKERCRVDVSHSHCIELISQLFGFKDWNTAKAELSAYDRVRALASVRSKKPEEPLSVKGMTVGELKKALEGFEDSATIDFDYEYNLGEYMNSIDDLANPEDTIHQEFAATALEEVDVDYACLKLTLKNESFSSAY